VYTVQTDKYLSKVQSLIEGRLGRFNGRVLGGYVCDVTRPSSMDVFFRQALPDLLHDNDGTLRTVVHSLAYAPNLRTTTLLQTGRDDFLLAHDVSSYSLIQVAREVVPYLQDEAGGDHHRDGGGGSITTLSYLGSQRAIPGYNVMGPAKASLEAVVRGLALEVGKYGVRVNAVRAGPIPTLSSRGGIARFDVMRGDVQDRAPLGNVTASQVAATLYHVAADAAGVTGQVIDVDGGYSIVAGPPIL
jgi:enoyl-[acyl-carrier protein] reductase I